jgi:hypothetical protein
MKHSEKQGSVFRLSAVISLSAVLLLTALSVSEAALASGGNSANAKLCQKGGWESQALQSGSGQSLLFASQDQCVSYGARQGPLFAPSLTAVPSDVVEDQGIDLTAAGFHPSSSGTLTVDLAGGGSITLPAVTNASGGLTFTSVFTPGACTAGITGADYTLVDGSGVHASTFVTLDCP